jgi:hypothetical protein
MDSTPSDPASSSEEQQEQDDSEELQDGEFPTLIEPNGKHAPTPMNSNSDTNYVLDDLDRLHLVDMRILLVGEQRNGRGHKPVLR